MKPESGCDPAFTEAVLALAHKRDGRPLVEMLFMDHPKNVDEWALLAAYLAGVLKKRPGKAPDQTVSRAAELYPKIKQAMPAAMAQAGRRLRHGQARKAAIACTLAYLREHGYALAPDTEQKLENRLRRSKRPRRK